MSKLLIVEDSIIMRGIFKKLLDEHTDFQYDLVGKYEEAKVLLSKYRYEFAVVERLLSDAPNGEIIALLNKHNIAPLVFTKEINEDFFESFEGAKIVDYILKQKYNNITSVIEKLLQLKNNKTLTVIVVSKSNIYSAYLKQNLNLHNFKVIYVNSKEDAEEKINLHPETSLLIVDAKGLDALSLIQDVRVMRDSSKLKILALVEESNLFTTSSLLNAGANDSLIKQFSRDEFNVRVYQNIY